MGEYMENGAKEEEESIPSMHQEISNHIIWKYLCLHMGHDSIMIEFIFSKNFSVLTARSTLIYALFW